MLPAQRGQVSQQDIWDVFRLSQNLDGAFEISGIPKNDRRNDEVEAGSAVLLIFVCAVADFAETMDEDRPCETVARFAFVEFLSGPASQIGVVDPVESEERARRPSSRSAAATPFCLGWDASWRMISDAVTVPPRMEAAILRISAQCARIRGISMRPAIRGSRVG